MSEHIQPGLQIYLTVSRAKEAIDFYEKAFGGKEIMRQDAEDGRRILHATLKIFGGHIMLSDEFSEFDADVKSPQTLGGTGVTIHVNRANPKEVDEVMAKAVAHGANITMPAKKQMWGAHYGRLIDPFGHSWSFAAETEQN